MGQKQNKASYREKEVPVLLTINELNKNFYRLLEATPVENWQVLFANAEFETDINLYLIWAVRQGSEHMVSSLLKNGADANTKIGFGASILRQALDDEKTNIITLLLESGANTDDKFSYMPLVKSALKCKDITIFRQFIRADAVNQKNLNSLVRAAVEFKNFQALAILIDQGADIDAKDSNGNTALHDAIRIKKGYIDAIDLCLAHNPAIDIKNGRGLTQFNLMITKARERMADAGHILQYALLTNPKRLAEFIKEDFVEDSDRLIGFTDGQLVGMITDEKVVSVISEQLKKVCKHEIMAIDLRDYKCSSINEKNLHLLPIDQNKPNQLSVIFSLSIVHAMLKKCEFEPSYVVHSGEQIRHLLMCLNDFYNNQQTSVISGSYEDIMLMRIIVLGKNIKWPESAIFRKQTYGIHRFFDIDIICDTSKNSINSPNDKNVIPNDENMTKVNSLM